MLQTQNNTPASSSRPSPADLTGQLIDAARKAGADAAEAVFGESRSLSIGVRKGAVETIESDETSDLGLRVFVGQKQAVVSVSEFSPRTLERLVERCVAMARIAPDDAYTGLADKALLYSGHTDGLDIFDPTELNAETLKDRALSAEAAGVALDQALQSDSASAGRVQSRWYMQTSDGFSGAQASSLFFQSTRLIATDANGGMERDGEGRSTRHYADLPSPEDTGRIAGERTLKALGARKIDSQKAPVIFEARSAKSLIGLFLGAISGPSVARGSSYLKDRLGQAVFGSQINIIDDPLRVRGLGSGYYDDEGVAASVRHLIENGVLTTWLLNTASARQLGMVSTGHASRSLANPAGVSAHNVVLESGQRSFKDALGAAGKGVIITSMFGPSVNGDTGDWSAGASGFWFENGEIQYPVNELTVAGNLIDIFSRLEPLSDLEIRGTLDTPSILVDSLSLGGNRMAYAPEHDLNAELALLVDKARRAGALAQHLKAQGLIISYKSDGSIVTNADLEVNLWLKEALLEARPDYGWQSEESPDTEDRLKRDNLFVLDPIDGTIGFSKGSPYWTIALALVRDHRPVAAVVYAPDAQEMYSAALGGGAWLNGEPVRATQTAELEYAQGIGDGRIFFRDIWKEDWPKMEMSSRPSVAYRMVAVAAGRADFTLALTPKRDWDVAAATLIAEEADAKVSNHLGQGYDFNRNDTLKTSLICSNSTLYPEILRRCAHLETL